MSSLEFILPSAVVLSSKDYVLKVFGFLVFHRHLFLIPIFFSLIIWMDRYYSSFFDFGVAFPRCVLKPSCRELQGMCSEFLFQLVSPPPYFPVLWFQVLPPGTLVQAGPSTLWWLAAIVMRPSMPSVQLRGRASAALLLRTGAVSYFSVCSLPVLGTGSGLVPCLPSTLPPRP